SRPAGATAPAAARPWPRNPTRPSTPPLPNEESAVQLCEALRASFRHENAFTERHAAGARVHVKAHARLEHPLGGREEGAREVARARNPVGAAIIHQSVSGVVGIRDEDT